MYSLTIESANSFLEKLGNFFFVNEFKGNLKNFVVIPARMGHCHVKWYPGVFCKEGGWIQTRLEHFSPENYNASE